MTDILDLADDVIVVAGAEAGVARASAEYLARLGAHVVVSGTGVDATEGQLHAAVREFGRLDAVVLTPPMAPSSIAELTDVGSAIDAVVRSARAALELLLAHGGGRLVLVGTGPASPLPGLAALSVIDSAVFGLARAFGAQGESGPVRVNAVAPIVDGPSTAAFFDAHPYLERDRFGPDAVVSLVAFLCHRSCPVRAEVFAAGGGRVARVAAVTAPGVFAPDARVDAIAAAIDQIRSLERSIEPRTALDELLFVDV